MRKKGLWLTFILASLAVLAGDAVGCGLRGGCGRARIGHCGRVLAPCCPQPSFTDKFHARVARLTYDQVKALVDNNNKSQLSTELLVCLIWKESGFDPNVPSSASTATGLMQLTVAAVDDVNANTPAGIHFQHSEMTNPEKNIQCGTYYLTILIKRHGTIKAGLEHFGTGAGYADNILKCEQCIQSAPAILQPCLGAIHP